MFSFVMHVLAILAILKAIQCYIYSLLHFCKIFLCLRFVYPLLSLIEQLNYFNWTIELPLIGKLKPCMLP